MHLWCIRVYQGVHAQFPRSICLVGYLCTFGEALLHLRSQTLRRPVNRPAVYSLTKGTRCKLQALLNTASSFMAGLRPRLELQPLHSAPWTPPWRGWSSTVWWMTNRPCQIRPAECINQRSSPWATDLGQQHSCPHPDKAALLQQYVMVDSLTAGFVI